MIYIQHSNKNVEDNETLFRNLQNKPEAGFLGPREYDNYQKIIWPKLRDIFSNKCAYCERMQVDSKDLRQNIMLYRPFSLSNQKYKWLSWQWPNLLYVCAGCQSARNDGFKILGKIAHPPNCEIDHLTKIEDPLLLNPCWVNPADYFQYEFDHEKEEVAIVPNDSLGEKNAKAEYTINLLNLNREALAEERFLSWKKFSHEVKKFENDLSSNGEQKNEIFSKILTQCKDDKEFAGLKRFWLKEVIDSSSSFATQKEFFKDKIDDIFEPIIKISQPFPSCTKKSGIQENGDLDEKEMMTQNIVWNKVTRNQDDREKIRKIRRSVEEIFQKLFKNDDQLIVENMFSSGYSGAMVFHVVSVNGGAANIPSVVKIDEHRNIQQEYAKMRPLENRVPDGSYAKQAPVESSGELSGLQFEFGGQGLSKVSSFKQFMLDADWDAIKRVLDELLIPPMNLFWRKQRMAQFPWCYYDGQLPANFELEYIIENPDRVDDELTPEDIDFFGWEDVKNGRTQVIKVSGFEVTAVTQTHIKLNAPSGSRANSFKIKVKIDKGSHTFVEDTIIEEPIYGRIIQRRLPYLRGIAKDVLHMSQLEGFDANNSTIVNLNGHQLSNPLESLDELINSERSTVNSSLIHGDLNLENVLVTTFEDGSPRNIVIIDFASVMDNAHILRDFLCLEMNVWLYVVSEELDRLNMGKEVDAFFTAVHLPNQTQTKYHDLKSFKIIQNIRQHTQSHLVAPDDWGEYFKGLKIYMLGALDYENLNRLNYRPSPKAIAFWVASLCSSYPSADFTDLDVWLPNGAIVAPPANSNAQGENGAPQITGRKKVVVNKSAPPLQQTDLLKQMTQTLNDADLKEVCLHLETALDEISVYGNLGSGGLQSKNMALIGFCKRRGALLTLTEVLEHMRPYDSWRQSA